MTQRFCFMLSPVDTDKLRARGKCPIPTEKSEETSIGEGRIKALRCPML